MDEYQVRIALYTSFESYTPLGLLGHVPTPFAHVSAQVSQLILVEVGVNCTKRGSLQEWVPSEIRRIVWCLTSSEVKASSKSKPILSGFMELSSEPEPN